LLVHDDVNLITVSPLGDIVSFRVTVTALSRFINNFMLHIGALNPGCHRCLPINLNVNTSAEYTAIATARDRSALSAARMAP
jgi:hypothetical protein